MAQTTCKRWAACFSLTLVIALVSGCSGALATVPPTAAEWLGKPGQTVPAPTTAVSAASPAAATGADPSVVDGWTGTVVKLDSMAQFDDCFQRSDGERYGIDGSASGLTSQIESARQQGTAIQVWGHLLTDHGQATGY